MACHKAAPDVNIGASHIELDDAAGPEAGQIVKQEVVLDRLRSKRIGEQGGLPVLQLLPLSSNLGSEVGDLERGSFSFEGLEGIVNDLQERRDVRQLRGIVAVVSEGSEHVTEEGE
eukprot:751577-Hanusia_phi.AAC.6